MPSQVFCRQLWLSVRSLQKCLLFKIYKKNFWINASFWLSDHNAELGKKLKDSNGKSDGFTKTNKTTELTSEYVHNFYGFYVKNYWFKSVFPRCKKNLLQLFMTCSCLVDYIFHEWKCSIYLFLSTWLILPATYAYLKY